MPDRLKIGYALGGGAARGLAHIGVLKVLEEYDIHPDIIVGTSMGAIVGALYAGGYKAKDIERLAVGVDSRRLLLTDITFSPGGFIQGKKVASLLKSILGDLNFSDLNCSYACTATDVLTGEEIILSSGSLVDAIHASIALPGVFKPVKIKGRYLIDGGLLNEVPADICRRCGAEYVIGVNVIPDPEKVTLTTRKGRNPEIGKLPNLNAGTCEVNTESQPLPQSRLATVEKAIRDFISHYSRQRKNRAVEKPPGLVEVVRQSITIMQYHVALENIKSADLGISPETSEIGTWQFNKAAEAITAGERAARAARNQIIKIRETLTKEITGSK